MDSLQKLQAWYQSQCDGKWEYGFGISLGTTGHRGWYVHIDIAQTKLAGQPFAEVLENLGHPTDWIHCRVHDEMFEGHGGPGKLTEILQIFLAWAEKPATAS